MTDDEAPTIRMTDEVLPIPTMPELEEIPLARSPFELWATIKKSSKYYHQGLVEVSPGKYKPRPFKIHAVVMEVPHDTYIFKGGVGGQYRREDLQLLIKCGEKFQRI